MLLLAITFVLVAELVNTAVEAAVDVASTSFDPMAKIAKDIAAGAVLVAALNAVAVGYLVFSGEVADSKLALPHPALATRPPSSRSSRSPSRCIIVIAVKAYTGRGTPLRGGLPSGHAAVAFAGWMAVTLILEDSPQRFLISSVTFIMALLVAQTRVETGVHSASEVASGAAARRARHALPLPGVRMSDAVVRRRAPRASRRGRGARVRAVLELPRRAARCSRATAA